MPDLIVVLVIALVVVLVWRGPQTLPKLGEALGRGVRAAHDEARRDEAGPEPPGGSGSGDSEGSKGEG